jgi:hypothetical protein
MRVDWHLIAVVIFVWAILSVLGSVIKSDVGGANSGANTNCGKNYPIDYVIATNLFCEIGNDRH